MKLSKIIYEFHDAESMRDLQVDIIVDEIIFEGQVLETSSEQVMKTIEEISGACILIASS